MRDDFEISMAELDTAVDATLAAGALGARMTGGCFLALVAAPTALTVGEAVARAFAESGFAAPVAFVATAGNGVSRVD